MITPAPLPIMAVPDFVAGLVYGLTTEDHLTEIEQCFKGGEFMAKEIEYGISDIKAGGWDEDVQAALEFALVALQVPSALSTCESMKPEIKAIEDWISIVKDPKALIATASKHYLLHKKAVTADLD